LIENGAVSELVATEMAQNGLRKLDVDICISTTGIAGPLGGTEDKPVGLVWIGLATKKGVKARKFQFGDNRERNLQMTAMKWNWSVPDEKIKLKVEDSWVTLEGSVEWNYQREAAQKCVSDLIGVKGVTNKIKLESKIPDVVERTDIENALSRSWLVDDRKKKVSVNKNKVTVRGSVESLFQKDESERLDWNAPGVVDVVNELAVLQD
jgi:hypothetical protein